MESTEGMKFWGGRGVGSIESLVKTGKWSDDGEKWLEKREKCLKKLTSPECDFCHE